ncbi:unnamed protein product, partial [Dracunculus medinensis]|uniref:PSI domain-containing protein n=1 Tax=Dracunculus medinensis TaxID=318479 RepID=A0A0N4UMV8_DRAME
IFLDSVNGPLILRFKCVRSDDSIKYDFSSKKIVLLNTRNKRNIGDDYDDMEKTFRIPNDVEIQKDTIDHQYYVMEIYTNRSEMMKDYYIDILEMLEKPETVGNKSHPLLSNSYRRAVAARIQFDFPFYGHRMRNLTIATGGFVYIGDQSHSWLAATQYIAPLMANFDTHDAKSTIMYADDGKKFVIEWRNLQLREQRSEGFFIFQASLHKNGDIWFVYKNIPISVENISDSHHPVKLGMSDAYLFHHNIHNPLPNMAQTPSIKRVIYEYHRIEIQPSKITSNTIVLIKAQPTCIKFRTCDECSNATLKHFNCSWCHTKAKNGGPFCSDQAGLHRRRQQWIEGNCKDNGKITYCEQGEDYNEIEESDDDKSAENSPEQMHETQSPSEPDQVVPWDRNKQIENTVKTESDDFENSAKSGFLSLFVALIGVLLIISWYRPSRWHMPSSHVRYSASVHM